MSVNIFLSRSLCKLDLLRCCNRSLVCVCVCLYVCERERENDSYEVVNVCLANRSQDFEDSSFRVYVGEIFTLGNSNRLLLWNGVTIYFVTFITFYERCLNKIWLQMHSEFTFRINLVKDSTPTQNLLNVLKTSKQTKNKQV